MTFVFEIKSDVARLERPSLLSTSTTTTTVISSTTLLRSRMTMFSCDSSPYDTPHPSQLSMHEQADDIHELVEHLQAARLFPDIPVIEARDQVTGSPASAWESTDGGESSKLQSGASNVEGDASQLVVSQYYKDTIDQAVERTMEKMRIVQSVSFLMRLPDIQD